MSEYHDSFDILRDIKSYSFEPLAKKVTDYINCDELAAASAYVDPEQSPVPPRNPAPVHNKIWIGVYLFVLGYVSLTSQHTGPECEYFPASIA